MKELIKISMNITPERLDKLRVLAALRRTNRSEAVGELVDEEFDRAMTDAFADPRILAVKSIGTDEAPIPLVVTK